MNLIPSKSGTLEKRLTTQLIKANPGLGAKSSKIVTDLIDSGLSPSISSMMIMAVYNPSRTDGRGQGTRLKWFVEAVNSRYGQRLEHLRSDPSKFRSFIADMEEVVEMRDQLNGSDFNVSFQQAFLLWELGESADSVLALAQDCHDNIGMARSIIMKAAISVRNGMYPQLETAIHEQEYGWNQR